MALASVLALLVTATLPGLARAQVQRNILMIIVDDVGVDMIGAYQALEGSQMVPSTPTIDSLAAQGIIFTNLWSNPRCAVTRATIQTGQYGYRTGVLGPTGTLDLNTLALPEVLNIHNELNYTQATFGKWGLEHDYLSETGVKHPVRTGYDFFAGKSNCCINEGYYAYDRTTAEFLPGAPGSTCDPDDPKAHLDLTCSDWTPPVPAVNYATTENVNDTVRWINEDVPSGENWFVILSFNAGHIPFHAPPGDSPEDPNRLWNDFNPNGHFDPDPVTNPNRICVIEQSSRRVCYRAVIEAADTEIQRLFDEATINLNETTIIFLGDNGSVEDMAVSPFNPDRARSTLYEGGINVPLIISGDGVSAPGRVSEALVNTADLFTTVLELAGVDTSALPPDPNDPGGVPQDHDSFSLVPILSDDCNGGCSVESIREYAYAEIVNGSLTAKAIRNRAGYKLKYDELSDTWEFFYLGGDPSSTLDPDPFEENNLIVSYNPNTNELLTSPELQPILDGLFAKVGNGGENPNLPAANDDQDADATADASDNCPDTPNPLQGDRNGDGQGDACTFTCDLNLDGQINAADSFLAARIARGDLQDPDMAARADVAPLDGGPTDGEVNSADVLLITRAGRGENLAICNPSP